MEIQKVFSSYDDYGYEDSRIYSVLMDEEEMMLFSELQKEFASVKALRKSLKMAGKEMKNLAQTQPGLTTTQAKEILNVPGSATNRATKMLNAIDRKANIPEALNRQKNSIGNTVNNLESTFRNSFASPVKPTTAIANKLRQSYNGIRPAVAKPINPLKNQMNKNSLNIGTKI